MSPQVVVMATTIRRRFQDQLDAIWQDSKISLCGCASPGRCKKPLGFLFSKVMWLRKSNDALLRWLVLDVHLLWSYRRVFHVWSQLFFFKVQTGGLWAATNPLIVLLINFAGSWLTTNSNKVDIKNLWPLRQTRKARMTYACILLRMLACCQKQARRVSARMLLEASTTLACC